MPLETASIRPMQRHEWPVARDLFCDGVLQFPSAFDVNADALYDLDDETVRSIFVGSWITPPRRTFLAESVDRIIGMVVATQMPEAMEIGALYVCPHEQSKGIGTELVGSAVDYARQRRVGSLYLRVSSGNPEARRLYVREGFQPSDPPEIKPMKTDPTLFSEKLVKKL